VSTYVTFHSRTPAGILCSPVSPTGTISPRYIIALFPPVTLYFLTLKPKYPSIFQFSHIFVALTIYQFLLLIEPLAAHPNQPMLQNCLSCLTGHMLTICIANPYDKVCRRPILLPYGLKAAPLLTAVPHSRWLVTIGDLVDCRVVGGDCVTPDEPYHH